MSDTFQPPRMSDTCPICHCFKPPVCKCDEAQAIERERIAAGLEAKAKANLGWWPTDRVAAILAEAQGIRNGEHNTRKGEGE